MSRYCGVQHWSDYQPANKTTGTIQRLKIKKKIYVCLVNNLAVAHFSQENCEKLDTMFKRCNISRDAETLFFVGLLTPALRLENIGCQILVLLRFSKSGKRTVSDGFVKKSADSNSVSDSRRKHYKLIHTGRRMRRRCTSQAIVPGPQDATQSQANVPCARHTPHARTWTSDVAR